MAATTRCVLRWWYPYDELKALQKDCDEMAPHQKPMYRRNAVSAVSKIGLHFLISTPRLDTKHCHRKKWTG